MLLTACQLTRKFSEAKHCQPSAASAGAAAVAAERRAAGNRRILVIAIKSDESEPNCLYGQRRLLGTLKRSFLHGFIYKSNWYFEKGESAYVVNGCAVSPKTSLPLMTSEGKEVVHNYEGG